MCCASRPIYQVKECHYCFSAVELKKCTLLYFFCAFWWMADGCLVHFFEISSCKLIIALELVQSSANYKSFNGY